MRKLALMVAVVIALLVFPAHAVAGPQVPIGHSITSTVAYVDGNTVVTYVVYNDPNTSPAISHVTIPACLTPPPKVDFCPGEVSFGTDPTTGVTGVKCDAGGSYTMVVTYEGLLLHTQIGQAAIKAGPGFVLVPVDTINCQPLGIVLETFDATVETPMPNCSVLLTATSNGGNAAPVVFWRDGLVIATFAANFSGGEYRYSDNPPPREMVQTHDYKVVQGQDTLIDSVNCEAPTAVELEISAVCNLATEAVRVEVQSYLLDPGALLTLSRDESIISQFPAGPAGTIHTRLDPGSGGEYTVTGGGASATATIDCAPAPTAVSVASFTAAPSATIAGGCRITGNGRSTACVCRVGNRWHGAPMWMCR